MQKRNEWMVDYIRPSGLLVALWNDDPSGGTWNCINYARRQGVSTGNIWPDWALLRRGN